MTRTVAASAHISLADALAAGPPAPGNLAVSLFCHGTRQVEFYQPTGRDLQQPHQRDELYVVARGRGLFFDGMQRHSVEAGSVGGEAPSP